MIVKYLLKVALLGSAWVLWALIILSGFSIAHRWAEAEAFATNDT